MVEGNWRGVVGPKNLGAAEIAYWSDRLSEAVKTDEWTENLERNHWDADFRTGARSQAVPRRTLRGIALHIGEFTRGQVSRLTEFDVSEAKRVPSEAGTMGPTQRLAQFSSSLRFDDLPGEVVSKAKLCILDTLGCCIFGASLQPVQKLAAMVAAEGAAQSATVFGMPLRTSASLAALLNGTSAHAFQLDEIHLESTLHPGSLALPAAFALAETGRAVDGRELITAIVAGYEVGIRIGLAAKGGMFKSGFHNQGTTGVFVAAAAAARILGLDGHQTQHAFGIAGSQAAGLMAVQAGAMTKSFHSGRAAQSGIYAAQLARSGYTGISDVLDGAYGTFFSSFLDEWSEPGVDRRPRNAMGNPQSWVQTRACLEREHHRHDRDGRDHA